MIQYKCDRCGKEVDQKSADCYDVVSYKIRFYLDYTDKYDEYLDLCPRCVNELDKFLGGRSLLPDFPGEIACSKYSERVRRRIMKRKQDI